MRVFHLVIFGMIFSLLDCQAVDVDCLKIQNSMRGYYASCSSTNFLPLKVQSTVVILDDYIFNSAYSWKYWLRSYSGQIIKLDGHCTQNNPSNGQKKQFQNITFGITCYELPRRILPGDAIQITFFDDYYYDKLVYLLPIIINEQNEFQSLQTSNQNQVKLSRHIKQRHSISQEILLQSTQLQQKNIQKTK